jgi:hypothetical protein
MFLKYFLESIFYIAESILFITQFQHSKFSSNAKTSSKESQVGA